MTQILHSLGIIIISLPASEVVGVLISFWLNLLQYNIELSWFYLVSKLFKLC